MALPSAGMEQGEEQKSASAVATVSLATAPSSLVKSCSLETLLEDELEAPPRKKARTGSAQKSFAPVPELGKVLLNKPHQSEVAFVVHEITLQKAPLPKAGNWQLVFSEEGFGAASTDDDQVVLLQDFLSRTLVKDDDGELYVWERGKPRPWHLDTKKSMCELLEVSLELSTLAARHGHKVYRLVWPRGGCHFFWDALTVYSALKMQSFQGKRTVWLYRQRQLWWKSFAMLFGTGVHYTPGVATKDNDEERFDGIDNVRLPTGSLSTVGLLRVLMVLATSKPQAAGGVQGMAPKLAAQHVFRSLIQSSMYDKALVEFHLRCKDDWIPCWPAHEESAPDIVLEVKKGRASQHKMQFRDSDVYRGHQKAW